MKRLAMGLMHLIPKKTLHDIQDDDSRFIAKIKNNQKSLLNLVKEIEESSSIDSHYFNEIKQSNDIVQRDVFVYSNCTYPWSGIFIHSIIRIDKTINNGKTNTHYYISNSVDSAQNFLKKILQEWSVETMHFYKDTALQEDRCKINKGAFSLSILRSFVINILHLNKIENIGRKIIKTTYDLGEALMLFSMVRLKYGIVKH